MCEHSKVITFIDLAGHEKYLKTIVFGMTGHAPDFGMLMIGSNAGIVGMTKEHLVLALASGIVSVRYLITIAGCLAKLKEMTVMNIVKKCNFNFVKMYSK